MASERVNPDEDPAMVPAEPPPSADGCAYALLIVAGVVLVAVGLAVIVGLVGR